MTDWRDKKLAGSKKIAVCIYGQHRLGDHLLPFLRDAYDFSDHGYDTEFFCSIKEYLEFNEWTRPDTTVNEDYRMSNDEIEEQLNKYFHIKDINFISKDTDELLTHSHTAMTLGMADAILLKNKYESEYNLVYDLVFYQRTDSMFNDINIPRHVIKWFDQATLCDVATLQCSNNPKFWIADHLDHRKFMSDNTKPPYTGIQDLFMVSNSLAADAFAYEIMNALSYTPKHLKYTEQIQYPVVDRKNPHFTIIDTLHNIRCGLIKLSSVLNWNRELEYYHYNFTVVRDNFDLDKDPYDLSTFQAHHNQHAAFWLANGDTEWFLQCVESDNQ